MICVERETFESELVKLINRFSIENESDTPDYILAIYLLNCLKAYNLAVISRDGWHGFKPWSKGGENK